MVMQNTLGDGSVARDAQKVTSEIGNFFCIAIQDDLGNFDHQQTKCKDLMYQNPLITTFMNTRLSVVKGNSTTFL